MLTFQYNAMQWVPIDRQLERPHNRKSLRVHQEWRPKMANRRATIRNHQQYVFVVDIVDSVLCRILSTNEKWGEKQWKLEQKRAPKLGRWSTYRNWSKSIRPPDDFRSDNLQILWLNSNVFAGTCAKLPSHRWMWPTVRALNWYRALSIYWNWLNCSQASSIRMRVTWLDSNVAHMPAPISSIELCKSLKYLCLHHHSVRSVELCNRNREINQ